MEQKRYRLKKDIVSPEKTIIAGAIGYYKEQDGVYIFNDGTPSKFRYHYKTVENQPEWFELIPEQSKEDKIVIRHLEPHDSFKGNGADAFWYQFCSSQSLKGKPQLAIMGAIESVINGKEGKEWEQWHLVGSVHKDWLLNMPVWYAIEEDLGDIANLSITDKQDGTALPIEIKYTLNGVEKSAHLGNVKLLIQCLTYCCENNNPKSKYTNLPQRTNENKPSTNIPERDWEILTFKLADAIFTKGQDGFYRCNWWEHPADKWYAEELLSNPKGYAIHSVRRLSDNQVFSIGDKVEYGSISMKGEKMKLNITPIASFGIQGNQIFGYGEGGFLIAPLNYLHKHSPNPIPAEQPTEEKKYTEKDLLEAEQSGFNGARYTVPPYEPYKVGQLSFCATFDSGLLFKTFEDYKKGKTQFGSFGDKGWSSFINNNTNV